MQSPSWLRALTCDLGAPQRANKRMDQTWRGRSSVTDWHGRPCPGKFSTSSRATLVMRGR